MPRDEIDDSSSALTRHLRSKTGGRLIDLM
jgi:hypothetical protein